MFSSSCACLRAPVSGVVQSLAVSNTGQEVKVGDKVMQIVPDNAPLEIQAYVFNADIGFVKVGQPVTNMGINFMSSLLTEKDLGPDSIFVRYAAQERLLAMASDYLGEAPYLSNIVLIYSFETSETPSATQFWHKDYDDTKMFKIFIYCSDVDVPEDGALHVANRQAMKGIYASPLYSSRRFGDDQFFKMVDRSQATALCGPAGTTFICDTHQSFHYGSRCTRRPRLACFITYQHYAGLYPAGRVADPPPTAPDEMKLLVANQKAFHRSFGK